MTREEAIEHGKEQLEIFGGEHKEFIELAIKALEQEPTTKNDLGVDCIDRAELLKAVDTWDKFGCDADTKLVPYQDHYIPYIHYDDVIKCIKSMPSVTQQEPFKPMVEIDLYSVIKQKYIEREVLDKIRADVQNGIHHFLDGEPIIEIKEVLQIIDKYNADKEHE